MTLFENSLKRTEKKLRLTLAEIRAMSPGAMRKHIEKLNGKPVTIDPECKGLISREQLDKEIDEILAKG